MSEKPLEIDCAALKADLDAGRSVTLVDCREPFEHEIARLPGARLIPMSQTPAHAAELAACDGEVVVYCHHGMRSAQTAAWLRENGVPTARSLAGGIDAWAQRIDPSTPRY